MVRLRPVGKTSNSPIVGGRNGKPRHKRAHPHKQITGAGNPLPVLIHASPVTGWLIMPPRFATPVK